LHVERVPPRRQPVEREAAVAAGGGVGGERDAVAHGVALVDDARAGERRVAAALDDAPEDAAAVTQPEVDGGAGVADLDELKRRARKAARCGGDLVAPRRQRQL